MNNKRIKRPQAQKGKISPSTSHKKPPDQLPPLFSLRHTSTKYCISKCDKTEKAAFADKLHRLSQVSWAQLRQQPRHGLGYEKITRDAITPGIPSHIKEDVQFIAFRFDGMKPMVGYREGEVFHIIWFDRNFKVYPHG